MEIEEIEKVKKDVGEFVEKLLSLVPPYDRISLLLRESELSGDFRELSKVYPQFFYPEVFSIIQRLLKFEVKSSGNLSFDSDGIGYWLNDLITNIYKIFDDDDFRNELSKFIGKQFPNPLEEYVKLCMEAIKQQDDKMIEILRILTDSSCEPKELKKQVR